MAAADEGKADLVELIGGAAESDVKFTDADAGKPCLLYTSLQAH